MSLLFTKKKENHHLHLFEIDRSKMKVRLKLNEHKAYMKQISLIQFTEDDLYLLNAAQPIIEEKLDQIVEKFYQIIVRESHLGEIIDKHSTIARLKMTLRNHLYEMFSGQIDDKYINNRRKIANAHVRIGLEPKWYIAAFQNLLQTILTMIESYFLNQKELLDFTIALTKVFNLEKQIVLEMYELEKDAIVKETEKQKTILSQEVNKNAEELATISEVTTNSIVEIANKSKEVSERMENMSKIAIETESMSITGRQQLQTVKDSVFETHHQMIEMTNRMKQLSTATEKIADISKMVHSIADQTNLLALNASIEAARAGEYGKGFAVVADEVRKLAESTKVSVANVTQVLTEMNDCTAMISQTIEKNLQSIENMTSISNDTNEFFNEILRSMEKMKKENIWMDKELKQFSEIINEISTASEQIAYASENLSMITAKL